MSTGQTPASPSAVRPWVEMRLASGEIALIDAEDAPRIVRYSWRYSRTGGTERNPVKYVVASVDGKLTYLHRLVMNARGGSIVDHVDRDRLDCRKSNLRFADRYQNAHNSGPRATDGRTSQFKGVSWDKKARRWRACICKSRVIYNIGWFDSETAAAQAYDTASRELHGAFGYRNFA